VLLVFVPAALCGCQSMHNSSRPAAAPPPVSAEAAAIPPLDAALAPSPRSSKAKTDPAQDGSGFPAKLSRDQVYSAHLDLGRFQESQENYELAVEEYVKALEVAESRSARMASGKNAAKQALVHRRMGAALDHLGHFERAENEYRTALKISPNDPKVWNDAGYSYYLQGRWADAERALKTAVKLDPNNTKYMTNLGLSLTASGKFDEGLAELTRAGGPAFAHANAAYVLAGMGNIALAQQHYKTAL
jgi:Flp pilus assembly protein TadD